jgi:hypothetical protein
VLLVFLPTGESQLASIGGLSVGIMSATQGEYSTAQLLLDITQGARVTSSAYSTARPPPLSVRVAGAEGAVLGWPAARRRAEDAPQLLQPGLLAAQIPGGAAYAGTAQTDNIDGLLAADREGRIAAVSLGPAPTLLARLAALRSSRRLVVCDLPAGAQGQADLQALSEQRTPGELLIVVQRASDTAGHELLWVGVSGLAGPSGKSRSQTGGGLGAQSGGGQGAQSGGGQSSQTGGGLGAQSGDSELSSQTTKQRGLISAVDLAPTILSALDLAVPADMRGEKLETDGVLDSANLRALMARLQVIGPRRLRALAWLLSAWALLLLVSALSPGRDGARRARAMRVGALGVLWAPVAVLVAAALEPGAAVEYATITLACLALGALSDMLMPWPRALLAPAIVGVLALVADALAGTQLLMRSLLGPDPILGARFYGFGNELKSGVAVLVFAAVAAALHPTARARNGRGRATVARERRWRAVAAMAGAGILLAVAEGSARIGAGVGGVILVSAGTAIATVMLLERTATRRRALIVLISPLAGLVALAAIDLLTARGGGHFTGSILHARSVTDVRDIIVRRYTAAWDELKYQAMPVATAFALLYAAAGVRLRARLLTPVDSDPVWLAALAGGLASGIVGAFSEDSGPVLLVVAVFALGCVASYLWGRPTRAPAATEIAPAEIVIATGVPATAQSPDL